MRAREGTNDGKRLRSLYGVTFALLCVSTVKSQTTTVFTAQRVVSGLTQPLFVTAPPGDVNRLFIVQQTGQVLIFNLRTRKLKAKPFLNIQSRLTNTSAEQGLLGLAFDPNYAGNGKFYLNFTVPGGAFAS